MKDTSLQYDAKKYPNFKEYLWYEEHEEELMKRYNGRYIVIKDQKVIGDYGTRKLARQQTIPHHKPGTYIIHHCAEPEPGRMPRLIGHRLVTVTD